MNRRVWYVAYGSNLSAARFGCYVAGGRPMGGDRDYPGCRDRAEPQAMESLHIDGGLFFAGQSLTWGGGMAFYDPHLPGEVAARAYLLTFGQFSDVVAQEMRRLPEADLDLAEALTAGSHRLGDGRYETVLRVGARNGHPMLTFTAPWRCGDVATTPPSPAYVRVIAAGLAEAHGWARERIGRYLAAAPGARGTWTPDAVVTELSRAGGAPRTARSRPPPPG